MTALELFNVIFVVALALVWWRLHDAAHPGAGPGRDGGHYLAMSGLLVAGLPAPAEQQGGSRRLNDALGRIQRAGGYGETTAFVAEAKQTYEQVVDAFARGNIDGVARLLTDGVRQDFERFIAARQQRGETQALTFIGFRGAEIVDATYEAEMASIEMRFLADLVSVTRDADGKIIAGHPDRVAECAELWTFEYCSGRNSKGWRLAATDTDE